MNLRLSCVEKRAARAALLPLLERVLHETAAALDLEVPADELAGPLLARAGERPETLLIVAESAAAPEPVGLCVTAPLDDPLTGTATPVLVALWVEESLRHRGLARALVAEARRLLGERALPPLHVRVPHGDDALRAIGLRLDFERVWDLLRG